jgi:hypothetical protein
MAKPLRWPKDLTQLGPWDSMLSGFPLIGPEARAYRSVSRQLRNRSPGVMDHWGPDEETRRIFTVAADIMRKVFGWSSAYFIPDDPFRVLFWDYGMDLSVVEAACHLDEAFALDGKLDFVECAIENLTLGEVIQHIRTIPKTEDTRSPTL